MKATVPLQHKTSQTAVISSASKATSNPLQFKNVVEEVPLQILQNPLAAVNYHQNPLQLFSETPAQPNSRNPLQLIARQATGRQSKGGNNTGLPNNLKAGVESLSGYSMDDVRVHYNSDEPTQLQALAYTQGTDIHIAPGQEKHLPHETWHVVQQKQGRVQPLTEINNVALNDDKVLEREATLMGVKASQITGDQVHPIATIPPQKVMDQAPIQRAVYESGVYSTKKASLDKTDTKAVKDEWKDLNKLAQTAEANANTIAGNIQASITAGGVPVMTSKQSTWLVLKDTKSWGNVVEEQLNLLATTWNQQAPLYGSRPDYHMNINGTDTYADLTTPSESGYAGDHITDKLNTAGINQGSVVAADITYNGAAPAVKLKKHTLAALIARQKHRISVRSLESEYKPIRGRRDRKLPTLHQIMNYVPSESKGYARWVNKNINIESQFVSETENESEEEDTGY